MKIDTLLTQVNTEPANKTESDVKKLKLKKATEEFESFFLQTLWKSMRRTVVEGMPGKRSESKIYREMLDEAFANNMSQTNSFGLGKMLYEELAKKLDAQMPSKTDEKA